MTATPKPNFIFTGKHMAAIMLTFFGIIIAVNFGMAYMASHSWTGLVVKNSYVASQKFNAKLDAAKSQKQAGWNSKISYQSGVMHISLKGIDGNMLVLENAKLEFGRPAFEQQDQSISLRSTKGGMLEAIIKLKPGEWYLRILGSIDTIPYRRDARLLVDEDLNGVLQ